MPNLRAVALGFTDITDAGLKSISPLKDLEELRLQRTKVTDAGVKGLAQFKKLTYLDLAHTRVTTNAMTELQTALPECMIFTTGGAMFSPPDKPKP